MYITCLLNTITWEDSICQSEICHKDLPWNLFPLSLYTLIYGTWNSAGVTGKVKLGHGANPNSLHTPWEKRILRVLLCGTGGHQEQVGKSSLSLESVTARSLCNNSRLGTNDTKWGNCRSIVSYPHRPTADTRAHTSCSFPLRLLWN